jgi:hypothetical protein
MLQQIAPYIGYLASLLLALGLMVSNGLKFRWLNTAGNILFITYGLVIGALPVALTNAILLCINIYFLYKIYNRKEHFELLEFSTCGVFIDRFLTFYQEDIRVYFPEFKREQFKGNLNFVVLRDLAVANIFSAKQDTEGNAEVQLNYTVPKFRDFKVGKYIFETEKRYLNSKGVRRVYYNNVPNRNHKNFLLATGFTEKPVNEKTCLCRDI